MNKEIFEYLNINKYHEAGCKGQGVTIAVSDFNFKPDEIEDFNRFKDVESLFGSTFMRWSVPGNDHAVKVLDVIRQIAPKAKVYFMGDGYLSSFLNLADRKGADIVSVSMGVSAYARKASQDSKAILLAAAGNDGESNNLLTPAKEKEWVAVGAKNLKGEQVSRASYSTVGDGLEIMGLTGLKVKDGVGNTVNFHGTSCSTPVVTAMLALYMSANKLDREGARKFLKDNAHSMKERNEYTGYGLFILPDIPSFEVKEVDNMKIVLTEGENVAFVNDSPAELHTPPQNIDGRIMVGIRDVAELFNSHVSWDNEQKKVTITK